jgi:predicted nucleotidyltransferase
MVVNSPSIPGMDLGKDYKKKTLPEDSNSAKKKFETTKKELEKLKNFILKKYKFVQAIGVLPPQSIPHFIDEEEAPAESKEFVHLAIIFPDEKIKEFGKAKPEIIKELEKAKEKVWLHFWTPSDIWEICFDSKFDLSSAIGMSYPLYDKGILGALRVAEIHKSLVLQKFERYVVSYVIGGSLVRGDAEKSSDIDVFVIINDTDVKRMPRRELLGRLRGIIYQYVAEASSIAGVQNKLEPQIYLLTDFWEAVKDAHPVMFTFIRDGVPLYDRGTFMPWKALLRMGKLKPSPEAIDMFMSMGDGVIPRSKKTLLSDIFTNIFWGITTPAQALVMLNGSPPPNAKKELLREFKKQFYDTKMIEKKYIDFLDKVINTWRDYEHEKIKEISGKEIDSLLKQTENYLKRLKELRVQIEKKYQEKTIEELYKDLIRLLKILIGNKSQEKLFSEFEKVYVKKGKFTEKHLKILRGVVAARQEFKKGKSNSQKIDRARKDADILIKDLVEYNQRKDLVSVEKGRMGLKFKDKVIEILNADGKTFVFEGSNIKKIVDKVVDSSMEEVEKAIENQKKKDFVEFNPKVFEVLKKNLGDFEVIL